MVYAIRWLLWFLLRGLLSLRYRVQVQGLQTLDGLGRNQRVLILPNHPAYTDPMILLSQLGGILDPRPLVFEGTFKNPLMWPFMKIIDALRVPDMESASANARAVAEASVQAIIGGLKEGSNHILWPSGRLQRRGVEVLGGARAVTDILQAVPDCQIVLVRTRGLWGSGFSFAYTGSLPNLGARMLWGLGTLLANLLLFTPRRDITITIELLDRAKLPPLQRDQVNSFLESWYNAEGPEEPRYVPYHFLFGPRTYTYPPLAGMADVNLASIKAEVKAEVLAMLAEKLKRPLSPEEQRADTTLDQLGLDSLDRMEFSLHLEQRFGFTTDQVPASVGQCWALAAGLVEKGPPRAVPESWFRPLRRPTPPEVLGETLAEAFVERALRCRTDTVVADDLSGCLNYERLLVGALALSRQFATIPSTHVGLLLPASVGADLAFLALHLAGKVPVVLNWTTGPGNLAHAAHIIMGLTHLVSSQKFLDRIGVSIPGVENLYMEQLRKGITRLDLARLLLRVRWRPGAVRAEIPRVDPDSPAVVLFTSGSEKAPKAVPLTHRNLLSNIRGGLVSLQLIRTDSLIGFLPAFHSFGLTVTALAPLLAGMRVVHHPDPTDAGGLVRKIASYKVTVLAGTPTFVSYILDRVKEDELASIRLIVVGAEKCPQMIFDRCREWAPNAIVLEGYGITECSPVVAVNSPGAARPGTVGKPLPGVEVCVIDPDNEAVVETGRMGMLLVSGPNIFPGYIGHDGPAPFREREGKRWYVTGDLVEVDGEGFIRFAGRLKRFVKAGGEMISLPALEEPFSRIYPPTQEGPRVAVEGIESEGGGRRIVLFTTVEISLRDANTILWEEGFRGVMRLDEVRRVQAIPVLGTGKTDYKVLRAQIIQAKG